MTSVLARPARRQPPAPPGDDLVVAAPPVPQPAVTSGPAGLVQYALPAVASLGSLVFVLANPRPLFLVGGVLFALTAVAGGVALGLGQRSTARQRRLRDRVRYLEHLDEVAVEAEASAGQQHARAHWTDPPPDALWQVADRADRLWERRRGDPDELVVRVGTGPGPLARRVLLEGGPTGPLVDVDALCLEAAERLVADARTVPGLPVTVDLRAARSVVLRGPDPDVATTARALLAQLLAWHAPEDLRVAVLTTPERTAGWTWLKWAPHATHPQARDELGPERLVTADPAELARLLGEEVAARPAVGGLRREPSAYALVVVVDVPGPVATGSAALDAALAGAPVRDVTVVHLLDERAPLPGRVDADVQLSGGRLQVTQAGQVRSGRADRLRTADAEQLARRLAGRRLSADEGGDRAGGSAAPLSALLGAEPDRVDPQVAWRPRPEGEELTVALGVAPEGGLVQLDLKESALGGAGPHGLCVGATGSGKSELLRTLVLSLAARHAPERLAMVLVDFKGGATFAGLSRLPHVAGSLTNLADDLGLVDRFRDALVGEGQRRQELLSASGGFASVREYEQARARGADLAPLPSLLVVVDEFSELLAAEPDFIDAFVTVGRLGRSLGMHLLLASQRLEEGRLRGLESHLSYRIALRTFSAQESRTVLGVPDAYELPPVPGAAYLKVDTTVFARFQAGYVSGPWARAAEPEPDGAAVTGLRPFTAAPQHRGARPVAAASSSTGATTLETVVDRLVPGAVRAHQVWLPPLGAPPPLDAVLGRAGDGAGDGLRVAVGLVDRPREQAQEPLVLDLSGPAGNVVVVGGPQTGKSGFLRTLVASLALTTSPRDVQVYAVELAGGLGRLGELPHVGTTATRTQPELVRRLVGETAQLLAEREGRFRSRGVESAAAMRVARREGRLPEEDRGDVFLLVDGWASFRKEFEDLEPVVTDLAARGLGHGIHVVLATNRWTDLRPALRDSLGTRLELRLADAIESELGRAAAALVPADRPGRGLVPGPLHVQVAVPRVDGVEGTDGLADASAALVERVRAAHGGAAAPVVRTLPPLVLVDRLPAPGADREPGVPVGLGERDLGPAYVDLSGPDPHLLVLGDGQSGKTAFLHTLLTGLVARRTPDEARVVLVDYRRTLLEVVPASHLLAYAGSSPALGPAVVDLVGSLQRRLPGLDVTAEQLRTRSWWTGPEVYLVVDDHDLVVTATSNPLSPLVDLLAQARDVGLHLVVARRSGGAGRAFFEPVLQRLRDLATPGLLLSGDPSEGPLLGPHRPQPQPAGRGLLVGRSGAQLVQVATRAAPGLTPRA